ncbi:hypothetical protein Glove_29g49 [Diversispora epigaea]|uniref:Uncharacterized protein n=1 Tax=Diversispora epigaea TaxID=1348612 RepID=A0A397JU27_9GLOM|nr:hypothetical protein Glove_29g49 [Diversispora epigaea]
MSSIKKFIKNLSQIHVANNKRKERAERKFKLEEERKLKANEVDEEWRWRCWLEDYKYYLKNDFNYQDFDKIMKLPFLDKLLNPNCLGEISWQGKLFFWIDCEK